MFKKTAILVCAYTLFSCGGGGGGGGAQTSSGNQQQTVQTAPTVTFSVNESQPEQDDNFELSWSASTGASCTASGSWSGSKARSGSETFASSETGIYEFTLTCSNSAGDTTKSLSVTVIEKTYTISGVVKAASFVELDGDVPSSDYPQVGNNGNDEGIQLIVNPAKLIGYVTDAEDGDELDIYEIGLTGNQWVGLEIADYNADDPNSVDLDVYVVNEDIEIISYGVSTEAFESVALPDSGKYYILVASISGSSRYVLTVANTVASYSFSNYSSSASVVPDSMVVARVHAASPNQNDDGFKNLSEIDRSIMRELRFEFRDSYDSILDKGSSGMRVMRSGSMTQDSKPERNYLEKIRRMLGKRWNVLLTDDVSKQILTKKYIARKSKLVDGLKLSPQMELSAFGFQKDPLFEYQWNYQQIGVQAALESIGSNQTDQIVAVLDQGSPPTSSVTYANTEFAEGGYDFISNDADPTASVKLVPDPYSSETHENHGIHVSGIIAAKNDGENLNGMGVKVLPIRVLSNEGNSGSALTEALKYFAGETNISGEVYDNSGGKLAALNLSLGVCVEDSYVLAEDANCQLISKIRDKGISVVAAAGNCKCGSKASPIYCPVKVFPAACPGVISVAAVDTASDRASYSSYHASVDIAAPGGDSSADLNADGVFDGVLSYIDLNDIEEKQGTSMAAPHVAGAIALMKHVDPNLSPAEVDALIQSGQVSRDDQQSAWSQELGYGVLDVSKALESVVDASSAAELVAVPFFSPSEYDFGYTESSFVLSIKKRGSGDLEVVGIYADIGEHLTYSVEETSEADDIAKYSFTIKRDEIADGSIQNFLYFLMSDNQYYGVPLRYSVGALRTPANVGSNILGVYDLDKEEFLEAIQVDMSSGSANFSFAGLPAGNYLLLAISDIDSSDEGDNWLIGELLAIYPDVTTLDSGLSLDEDLSDVEISLIPYSEKTIGPSSVRGKVARGSFQSLTAEKIARLSGS